MADQGKTKAAFALMLGALTIASVASAQVAGGQFTKAPPMALASVHGQTTCGVVGRMTVDAVIDSGRGGTGTVYVKSTHGAIASADFVAKANERITVVVHVPDASCATTGSFDVWLSTGTAHKTLVVGSVTFVEGAPPSSSVVGNAQGGG
jgi:hypothetical protein